MSESIALNIDCMEYMKTIPDKYFDLAVVDPPYGIEKAFTPTSRVAKYGQLKTANDLKPNADYFAELFRISKNQIIWGYNHLSDMLPSTKEFIFWYKHQPVVTYSDGELAWTSFTKTAKCFDYPFLGQMVQTMASVFIQRKNLLHYINGFSNDTQSKATKSSTRILAAALAELPHMMPDLILLVVKSTRNTSTSKNSVLRTIRRKRVCLAVFFRRRCDGKD